MRWHYIGRLGQVSPEGHMGSESVSNIWYCYSASQDSQIRNSKVEVEKKKCKTIRAEEYDRAPNTLECAVSILTPHMVADEEVDHQTR